MITYANVSTQLYRPAHIIWHMILTGDWTKSLSKALWGKTNTLRRGANRPGRHLWKQRRKTAEITAQRAFDCGRNPFWGKAKKRDMHRASSHPLFQMPVKSAFSWPESIALLKKKHVKGYHGRTMLLYFSLSFLKKNKLLFTKRSFTMCSFYSVS